MSVQPLLDVRGLSKSFGALRATDGLDLCVQPGELHALIGPNGAGKSTLMKQLSGEMQPDAGHIVYRGEDITEVSAAKRARLGIARSYQITSVFPDYTALENVAMAVQTRTTRGLSFLRRASGDPELEKPAGTILERVGLKDFLHRPAAELAHGQQRHGELELALLAVGELMAGMGPQESKILVDLLAELRGTVTILLVEHDMDAVFALADRVTVLVYGRAIASGTADDIRNNAAVREAYLGEGDDAA